MKAVFLRGCALVLAASLAACTTSGGGARRGVEVTNFHLGQAIARGPITVEATDPADANSLEFRAYSAAVERQLARLGWTVVQTIGQSEQVASVDVTQGSRAGLARRSPVSVGVGGSTGGYGSGVGVGVGVGLGGGGSTELVTTLLEVRIKRRSDGTIFWEGRASSEARASSADAQPTAAVERLAEALFRGFPGISGQTIRVR